MKTLFGFLLVFLSLFAGCVKAEATSMTVISTATGIPEPTVTPTSIEMVQPTVMPTLIVKETPTVTPTPEAVATPTSVPDTEAPVVTLLGEAQVEIIARSEFKDMGYIATDNFDGDVTEQVVVSGSVDVNLCGTYILGYEVSDKAGNYAKVERTVVVKQPETVIPEGKVIYLTFDDGPGKYTNEILDILKKYDIKATFFTCGNGMPALVKKIHEAGHTLAIHCKSHDYTVVYASEEAYFEDLFAMQDLIYECTGIRTTLVRFPGGSSNSSSAFNPGIMTRLAEQLNQRGFQYFDWNVSSGDTGTKDTEEILSNMIKGVKKHDWSIVLQHPEYKEYSMKALEQFIVWGLENDYRFLTLDNTSPGAHHTIYN